MMIILYLQKLKTSISLAEDGHMISISIWKMSAEEMCKICVQSENDHFVAFKAALAL